jgi:glycine betaine/proline transport system permease protein
MDIPMAFVRNVLTWLPWSVSLRFCIIVIVPIPHRAETCRLHGAVGGSTCWLWALDRIDEFAVAGRSSRCLWPSLRGFLAIGTWGFFHPRAERIMVTHNGSALQTVPAFAYLLPILLLFGFGVVVGLIARSSTPSRPWCATRCWACAASRKK